jgi:glycosyltransferase involved in cell wall biosynthesis
VNPGPDSPSSSFRVLHLNSRLTGGGTDDQSVKLADGLQRLGCQVWVAGPAGREFSKIIRDLGIPFHTTPPEGPLKLRFMLDVARFIRRERIQIVHGHHGCDLWPTVLAARLSGRRPKIVLTRHMAKSPSSWFSRRFLLGQCDALIAVSNFVARVLREGAYEPDSPMAERRSRPPLRGNHSKISVIYGGIDTERFRPMDGSRLRTDWGLQPGHFAFGMVGGYVLPFGKGQREFLQAAAKIHQQIPFARFLIIGRGNMGDALRDEINRLGLKEKAWLTPYYTNMPLAMNALDCLVHSQIGTEAMPGVVCEANACGRPVIASSLDGIPEALEIGGYGQLVQPGSVDELAAALSDQASAAKASEAKRLAVHFRVTQRFSLNQSAQNHRFFYARLLTGHYV